MRRLTMLSPSELLGVDERDHKLQIPVLVQACVGFTGKSRTLAGFRRGYNSTADKTISQWIRLS